MKLEGLGLTGAVDNIWHRTTTNLTFLERLHLKENSLKGSIPREWGKMRHLRELDISFNQLTGTLPFDLFGVHGAMGPEHANGLNLTMLNLARNRLSGNIPATVTNMTDLLDLNLASNHLTGPLPPFLNRLEQLTSLQLQGNRLQGPLPPAVTDMPKLRVLDLGGNRLR